MLEFPEIKRDEEQNFLDWFESTNQKFQKFEGFISRKLLIKKDEDIDGSKYVGILELKDRETFLNLHSSKMHKDTFLGLISILGDIPTKKFYEVLISNSSNSVSEVIYPKLQCKIA